ncbi:MAG: anti-sigma factor [Planctomycetota bacterium]
MSDQPQSDLDRLAELLADRALFGLDDAEDRELEGLAQLMSDAERESFDRAAASGQLAAIGVIEPMPAAVAEQVRRDGESMVAGFANPADRVVTRRPASGEGAVFSLREGLAWFVAAASLVFVWFATLDQPAELAELDPIEAVDPSSSSEGPSSEDKPLSVESLRAELLADAEASPGEVVLVEWAPGGDASGAEAEGDVLWSNKRQRGVMRFRGLAANDPTAEQYQLWIFDEAQDDDYPIDGGVFDVPSSEGDVLVEVDAKLPVTGVKLFAVTVEKPGGVVVSSRERLPLLANVSR